MLKYFLEIYHFYPFQGYELQFLPSTLLEAPTIPLNQYGRLFLRNTTVLFNPSLSQQTVLYRFSPCTLDTIVPNPKSNPLNIRKYFVFTDNYGVHLGHCKTFCRKKTRVRCKKNRVPAEP
jgi:hypothetical protein